MDDDCWYWIHVWLGQIGFIKFVILPYFKVMSEVLPAVLPLVEMVDMQQNYVCLCLMYTIFNFLLAVFYINYPWNHFLEVDMNIHKKKVIKSFLAVIFSCWYARREELESLCDTDHYTRWKQIYTAGSHLKSGGQLSSLQDQSHLALPAKAELFWFEYWKGAILVSLLYFLG